MNSAYYDGTLVASEPTIVTFDLVFKFICDHEIPKDLIDDNIGSIYALPVIDELVT